MSIKDLISQELNESAKVLHTFMQNAEAINAIDEAATAMISAINNGNKIISCGNGGSMSDAMHFAEELTGRFRENRKSLPAIAISDPSYLTCAANDYGYASVFSRFVEGMGNTNDVLLALSTSGNSENVIEAAKAAKSKGMKVIALTGKDGGKLAELVDIEIRAPHSRFSDRVQEIHIKVIHILIAAIESGLAAK